VLTGFRIARKVAADRVISTVDHQARHGHKTNAHGFDGYQGIWPPIPIPRSSPPRR
jgi:hypothetical protein